MLENPPKEASFDHVDADGNLIFTCENTPLLIQVDDTLERAIAEAHKIARKHIEDNNATDANTTMSATAALPISQIQALIRAGVDPSHVAQRYNVSETQVRRFSAGVETEKQYAIEQFLLVPAPKQSNMRTLSDLIERTLAKAHIGMETVKWRATRRGLEPWLITATFKTATRTIKAEWTWNMHDNSVTCANPSSRLLLGEDVNAAEAAKQAPYGGAYRDTVSINFPFSTDELPGNSIRSARIERAVSQWELRNSDKLSEISSQNSSTSRNSSSISNAEKLEQNAATNSNNTSKKTPVTNENSVQNPEPIQSTENSSNSANTNKTSGRTNKSNKTTKTAAKAEETSVETKVETSVEQKPLVSSKRETSKADTSENKHLDNSSNAQNVAENNQETATSEKTEKSSTEHNKRRSGRAAVPSWDEILFGEG